MVDLLMSQLMKRNPLSQTLYRPLLDNFLADKIFLERTEIWRESMIIEFDRNWCENEFGGRRQISICPRHISCSLYFHLLKVSFLFEYIFCTFGDNFLLMVDRPQPIRLSTQMITEICTHMYVAAWNKYCHPVHIHK